MKNENRAQAAVIAIVVIVLVVVAVVAYYFLTKAPEKFVCDTCEEEFDTQEELDAHILEAHGLECETCAEKFLTQAELNQHLWTAPGHPKITLTIWGWHANEGYIADTAVETGFTEAYPNIELNPVGQAEAADEYDLITIATITGEGAADLVGVEVDRGQHFVNIGILLPLNEYGAMDYADLFPEWFWNFYVSEGKIYGIPWDTSGASGLYYRSDIFEQYGLTVPTTMDGWTEVGLELKAANPDMYMTFFGTDSPQYLMMLINSQGAEIFRKTADGKYVSNLDSPEALKAMTFMNDMVEAELAKATPMWTDEMMAEIKGDVYATVLCAQWYGGFLQGWMDAKRPGAWKVAPFPQWEPGVKTSANWGGTSYCITTQSEHPDAAWELLKWVWLDKDHAKLLYGKCGYLPAYLELQTDPDIAFEDPYWCDQNWNKVIAEEWMPYVPSMDFSPYADLFWTYVTPAMEQVLLGDMSPADALAEAKALIDADIAARE